MEGGGGSGGGGVEAGANVPELYDLSQLPENSSFKNVNEYRKAFATAMRKVVGEISSQIDQGNRTDWVFLTGQVNEKYFKETFDNLSDSDWDFAAESGISVSSDLSFAYGQVPMMMRVWEEMSKTPGQEGLSFYRGADLHDDGSFGADWAPAGLYEALDYVKKGQGGVKAETRKNPGLVAVSFKSVVEAYKKSQITLELEHGFGTGSVNFLLKGDALKNVGKWKVSGGVPTNPQASAYIK